MKELFTILLTIVLVTTFFSTFNKAIASKSTNNNQPKSSNKSGAELANAEKAVAVLESLETGNPQPIINYVSENNYIQHNLKFADGRQAILDALNPLQETNPTVEVQRVFTDGDYVFTHTKYSLFGKPQAGFDIFRFKDGIIVEHWDNLTSISEPNPSGHTQFDGATEITDFDKTKENKKLIVGFIHDVLMGENPGNSTNYFNGDNYIQHNPDIADGLSGLGEALEIMAENNIEMVYNKIHMVLGQGNFVLTVCEGKYADKHTSYYDLWRIENGKIVEHWDVIETITPESKRANNNGKF